MERQQLTSLVNQHLAPADAATILGLARPAIALRHAAPGTGHRTHLGGDAALEPGQAWPMWHGKPLSLLAVLDLEAFRGLDCDLDLPRSGLLNLFYDDVEQPWGFDPADRGGWRTMLATASAAEDRAEPAGGTRFTRLDLVPEQTLTVPDWGEEVMIPLSRLDTDALDELGEALAEATEASGPKHQVGGWPTLQQDSLWSEFQFASNGVYGRLRGTPRVRTAAGRRRLAAAGPDRHRR